MRYFWYGGSDGGRISSRGFGNGWGLDGGIFRPQKPDPSALVVVRDARRKPLKVLCGSGFRPPLRVQLRDRRNWRFERKAALAVPHNLVLPAAGDFNDLANLQVKSLNRSRRHSVILDMRTRGGLRRAESARNAENPAGARQAEAALLDPNLGVASSAMLSPDEF